MAAAALSPLDLSQNPAAAAAGSATTSRYHIQDAEFRPNDAAAMQAAMLAMGGVSGMQQVVHKKKKKHKVKVEGGEQVEPEAAERRRKRKIELLEKKKRRKRKQKDKAKEMSDAFNALKDDDHVPVMNPRSGERYIGPAAPMKKQLGAWMKEHPGFELLYPFHAVVSPDGTSVSFPPLPKASQDASHSGEPPKKKKKKTQRNPAKLDPAKLTGEERVDMIDRNTGKKLPYKLNPTLNNLTIWLVSNPAYDVTAEWGNIVKERGYIGEELYSRISHLSMKPKPVAKPSSSAPAARVVASGLATNKLSMQIGQGSLGGLATLGLTTFANAAAASQQLGASPAMAATQQLLTLQAVGQRKIRAKTPKKKKLKTSHPVVAPKPIQVPTASVVASPPPVSGVPSLAGISPYLLPTQGGVFYSPFLASRNVQGLISSTTTATTTSTTNSLDNDSQSSIDSTKLSRTEERGDSEDDVAMSEGALGNFTDDNDSTFAGVDLGDLDGELGDNVITDIAMDDEDDA